MFDLRGDLIYHSIAEKKKKERAMFLKRKSFLLQSVVILIFLSSLSYSQEWKGKGRIRGNVLGEDGEPIANATITLTHLKLKAKLNVITDKKGWFLAAWVKGGSWHVDVEAVGYIPRKASYEVSEITPNPAMEIILKKTEKTVVREDLVETVKGLLLEGNELFEQKKHEEALAIFKEIAEKVPELYQINLNIGNCYYEMGDYDSAIPCYKAVLEKEPENQDALVSLGNVYLEKGELEKGMELFSKLSDEGAASPIALYNIATNLFNKGELETAARYYEQALDLDQNMADAYYQLGLCYLNLNKKEKAKESFLKYLELKPDSDKAQQVKAFLEYLDRDN
jgi:Tfp pilus assembly protein PilF